MHGAELLLDANVGYFLVSILHGPSAGLALVAHLLTAYSNIEHICRQPLFAEADAQESCWKACRNDTSCC